MKFKDVNFRNKQRFKKNVVCEIYDMMVLEDFGQDFSELAVKRYLEILIEEQDFNPKTHLFYDRFTNRKLNFRFLASVARDYIFENMADFLR